MKLNADIIVEQLKKHFQVEMSGKPDAALNLSHPILYRDDRSDFLFLANNLYIASANQLPTYPKLQKDVVLVCVGDSFHLSHYYTNCTVILIRERCDIFSVYMKIQEIFNYYDAWNDRLFELHRENADIQKLLEVSAPIFNSPLVVVDQDFHFLAATASAEAELGGKWKDERKNLSQYAIERFLSENEMKMEVKEPIFLKILDTNALCVNLFDRSAKYIGAFCVLITENSYKPSMDALAVYLARVIEKSIQKNPHIMTTERNMLKNMLRDLIHGSPVNPNYRWYLNESQQNVEYVCIVLCSLDPVNSLPAVYICNAFETAFPHGLAFSTEYAIIGLVELRRLGQDDEIGKSQLDEILLPLLRSMKICAGISNEFSNLYLAKTYYQQAEAAVEKGSMLNPREQRHYFSDYALMEMVINSLSGHPIETYFPSGLKTLYDHDKASELSYLKTLKVFLDENMSISKAANVLHVHRSTFIDRIARIERDLGIDLHDPDERLYLHLLLKGLEVQDSINANSHHK